MVLQRNAADDAHTTGVVATESSEGTEPVALRTHSNDEERPDYKGVDLIIDLFNLGVLRD
jgi:hypothetical protein